MFSKGFRREEGASKAVLPSLRLELHSLTFGFCSLSLFQKGSFDVCSALPDGGVQKKGLKA